MQNIILNQLEKESYFQISKFKENILVNPLTTEAKRELLGLEKLINEIYPQLFNKSVPSNKMKEEIETFVKSFSFKEKTYLLINYDLLENQLNLIYSFLKDKKVLKKLKSKKIPEQLKESLEVLYSILSNILFYSKQ